MNRELRVFDSIESMSIAAAHFMFERAASLLSSAGRADIILSGGNTPRRCYEQLSSLLQTGGNGIRNINWILGDERWISADDPESNEHMVRSTLLRGMNKDLGTLHSWKPCKRSQYISAVEYANNIDYILGRGKKEPDLLLLGLGEDGHTASLFPGSLILHENGELVELSPNVPGNAVTLYVPQKKSWRLTLTPRLLNSAAVVVFLVSGIEKKQSLGALLDCPGSSLPSCWIKGKKTVYFATSDCVDEAYMKSRKLPAVIDLENS
jgi:6-phosphogluconolactonase